MRDETDIERHHDTVLVRVCSPLAMHRDALAHALRRDRRLRLEMVADVGHCAVTPSVPTVVLLDAEAAELAEGAARASRVMPVVLWGRESVPAAVVPLLWPRGRVRHVPTGAAASALLAAVVAAAFSPGETSSPDAKPDPGRSSARRAAPFAVSPDEDAVLRAYLVDHPTLPLGQVAEQVGMKVNTFRSHLGRVRRRLHSGEASSRIGLLKVLLQVGWDDHATTVTPWNGDRPTVETSEYVGNLPET